jgi:RNA polymerase sigma-70 factor (ECF subfamily)
MLPHLDAAYNLARYLARDPVAAEDIVQDAFLRAFRSFHTFAGGNAKAWLFAIVRNGFLDWRKANPRIDLGEEFLEGAGADHNHPEAILVREGEAKALRETLANLPEPFRETLVLRELEELSYKEISQLTGAPIGTVMSRLARARTMLGALMFAGEGRGLEARP